MLARLNSAVDARPTDAAADEELKHLVDALAERPEMSCTGYMQCIGDAGPGW
jgi:hypothetical protein